MKTKDSLSFENNDTTAPQQAIITEACSKLTEY